MRYRGGEMVFFYLLLLGLCNHVAGHISYALVYDFGHGSHDALRLGAVEPLTFQPLNKVVSVEMEFISRTSRGKGPSKSATWKSKCKMKHVCFGRHFARLLVLAANSAEYVSGLQSQHIQLYYRVKTQQ